VAKAKLVDLEFVAEELILEGVGGPSARRARSLAEELERHVTSGTSLAKYRKQLVRAVGAFTDKSARVRTIRVLATEAAREGDDKALAALEKIQPGTVAKQQATADRVPLKKRVEVCSKVERACIQGRTPVPAEVAKLVSWLGTPAEGRGHARIDLGYRACVALMRVLLHPKAGSEVKNTLKSMLGEAGTAGNDARRALAAAAAYQERWREVDELSKVTGPPLASVASGLGTASAYRLFDRPIEQARAERGAPLPKFRPEIEKRFRALAKRGSAAVKKECDDALARLARGR
jgi:hypothetical protein